MLCSSFWYKLWVLVQAAHLFQQLLLPRFLPTTDPLQSAKIVQAFWDAMEAGDLETAMAYIGDNVTCSGFCYFKGKATFRSYMQGYLDGGYSTTISDVRTVGNIVTYSWEVYRNGNFLRGGDSEEMMEVEDGKIIYWENQHR